MTDGLMADPPAGVTPGPVLATIGDEWDRACRYVKRALAIESSRPALEYVALGRDGALIAVDGFRFHMVEHAATVSPDAWPALGPFLIPPALVRPGVTINLTNDPNVFSADHPRLCRVWWARPVGGPLYPSFRLILAYTYTSEAEIGDPKRLARAVRYPPGVVVSPEGASRSIPWLPPKRLTRDEKAIMRLDIARECVSVQHLYRRPYALCQVGRLVQGEPIRCAVNPRYLFEALAGLSGVVSLSVAAEKRAIMLRSGSVTAVVMGMQSGIKEGTERWPGQVSVEADQ